MVMQLNVFLRTNTYEFNFVHQDHSLLLKRNYIVKPLKGIISYAETLFHLDQTLKTVFMFLAIPLNLFYFMVQKYGVTLTHLRKYFNQMI